MFPAIVVAWILPEGSPIIWPAILAIVWGLVVGALGAVQGILLACGKLHLGCPLCDTRSFVSGGDRDGIYLDCPHCGDLRLKVGRLAGLKTIRAGSAEDELADLPASPGAPLLAPVRHWLPFLFMFLPVVASVVAASMIHEFKLFYLLMPGFWCYAVGGVHPGRAFLGNHG